LLVVLALVLNRIIIQLLLIILLATGHSCHAILILVALLIVVHVEARLTTSFVIVQLTHKQIERCNQTVHIYIV